MRSGLRNKVLVEKDDFAFFVGRQLGIDYENLPEFCDSCQCIGHSIVNCRKNSAADYKDGDESHGKEALDNNAVKKKIVSMYVPKQKVLDKGKEVIIDTSRSIEVPFNEGIDNKENDRNVADLSKGKAVVNLDDTVCNDGRVIVESEPTDIAELVGINNVSVDKTTNGDVNPILGMINVSNKEAQVNDPSVIEGFLDKVTHLQEVEPLR